eukprot:PITA_33084
MWKEGRKILNNIIQAHEVVHSLKSNKEAGMIIQLDLAKAYDKLCGSYIRAVLRAYSFDQNWIRWVMTLVTMTSFSILLNGTPSRIFTPSRGLRQGDPLSPFLFVLMMGGLGRVIKMENVEGRIQGIKLTLDGEANTHQQFVDDTMLQGIPIIREARVIKQILNDFAMAAGIEVSLNKSIVFSFNTDIAIHRNITKILGFQRDRLPSKYLGIRPIGKHLTLPVPKGVQQQIISIQSYFLWGRGEEKKKWSVVAWDKIWKPLSHGGLGLHDRETLNRASRTKLWWRWIKELATP